MSAPVLEVEGMVLSYDADPVVEDVSFTLPAGRVVGIFGPNGAGKSTLIKGILGLIPVDKGVVRAFERPLREVKRRVVYIPQRSAVDWDFPVTVYDVVLMGRYGHLGLFGRPSKADHRIAEASMEKMGISALRDRQISAISGGQQQRVFLARALAQEGDLLFMDEPFVGVDAKTEAVIIDLLRLMREEGKTTVVVNHDLHTAQEYFDDVLLLNRTLIALGPTERVFNAETLARCYGGKLAILKTEGGDATLLAQ